MLAASAAAAASLYTYFQGQQTVEICTAPATIDTGGRNVTFIGSSRALQPLADPSPRTSASVDSLNRAFSQLMTPVHATSPVDPLLLHAKPEITPSAFANFEQLQRELTTAKVRGSLTDELGFPLSMGTVQITPVDQAGSWLRTLTRSDGTFEILAAPGKYLMYAHANGYRDFTMTLVKTNSLHPPVRIKLPKSTP